MDETVNANNNAINNDTNAKKGPPIGPPTTATTGASKMVGVGTADTLRLDKAKAAANVNANTNGKDNATPLLVAETDTTATTTTTTANVTANASTSASTSTSTSTAKTPLPNKSKTRTGTGTGTTTTMKTATKTTTVGGTTTPPSSGSSARRQKLQVMRAQAKAASELLKNNQNQTSNNASNNYSAANSYSAIANGPPATEAFARAIGVTVGLPPVAATTSANTNTTTTSGPPPLASSSSSSPSSMMHSAAQSRLEDAYQTLEQQQRDALLKIKQLENQLSGTIQKDIKRMGNNNSSISNHGLDVRHLLSLAETQGPEAALQWAKSVDGSNSSTNGNAFSTFRPAAQMGFNTGIMTPRRGVHTPVMTADSPMRRARIAGRNLTPHPAKLETAGVSASGRSNTNTNTNTNANNNNNNNNNNETPEQTERRLLRSFRQAAKYVPFEFSSDLATYTVQRPYGIPTNPQLFDLVSCQRRGRGNTNSNADRAASYAKRAHVSDKTTLEVAVVVKADNTPALIFGVAGIRYRTNGSSSNHNNNNNNANTNDSEWKHFDNVDDLDRTLGHVTYIDAKANEQEYSLDEILEEALLVREQYCGTLTSTALGLDARPQAEAQVQPPVVAAAAAAGSEQQQQQQQQQQGTATSNTESGREQRQQQQQAPPSKDEAGPSSSSSSDVLVVFLGMMVSFVVRLVWSVVIGTPLRILRTVVVLTAAYFVMQTLHSYLADDYTDWALREMGGHYGGADDPAYYSNRRPGIL